MSGTDVRPPWYLGTASRWFTIAITGLIAAAGVHAAVTEPEGRVFAGFVSLVMGSVCVMLLTTSSTTVPRWSSAELEGRPAWSLALGPGGSLSAVALAVTSLGAGLAWGAVSIARDASGGSVPVAALVGLLAAFLLVVGAQLWLTRLRAPTFTVSADHLRYAGVGVVVDLAWDDVASVEHADRTGRWACVKVIARVGARTYAVERRRTLLPVDRVPDPAGIELRHSLLADVPQVLRLLREMHVGERATRESLISLGLPGASGR